jgi:NAD(P)-dependent dehydrogenase (short-subunit alcohol dehydrogenase family)
MSIIAITGAAGRIGTALRTLLARPGRTLRLIDVTQPANLAADREQFVNVDVGDEEGMRRALTGVTGLVHLAGLASEHPWREILGTNIHGTYVALESARAAGVRNVFLASSIHAVGTATLSQSAEAVEPNPRPDTFYGVSKAAMEGLGHVFAARCGMSIVSARICHFGDDPGSGLSRLIWVSPPDLTRLVEATLALTEPGHHVVWCVSRNGAPWLRPEAGAAIGFLPADDAGPVAVDQHTRLGGEFLDVPLGMKRG